MNDANLVGMMAIVGLRWILPLLVPLAFVIRIRRKILFYFLGMIVTYACIAIAPALWGSLVVLYSITANVLSGNPIDHNPHQAFSRLLPGLEKGSFDPVLAAVPMLILGCVLACLCLLLLRKACNRHSNQGVQGTPATAGAPDA